MAKKQIFERKQERDYLAELEDLLKKNKGTGLYEAFDVNPRAFRVGGKVYNPSGLGQDKMNDSIKYAQYSPTSIAMNAPNVGGVDRFPFQNLEQTPEKDVLKIRGEEVDPNTSQGFSRIINEMVSIPVSHTDDGGILMSNGSVQYQDGRTRPATREDVPQIVTQFDNGWAMLTNGSIVNLSGGIGSGYRGVSGLSDLLFNRQQPVTQEYGNINPIEPTVGNVNYGTDFRTRDLPENFNFTLPFEAKVVGITYDDGTRFGDKSGHQGYGNSVVLQLPNGSMIRMAHLSDMENFHVGDNVKAFDYIGTPGQSGNTYGEHLDLEYYNQDGQIADPRTFWIDSGDLVDFRQIEDSQLGGLDKVPPELQDWAKAQQDLIAKGGQMTLDQSRFRQTNQEQNVGQAEQQVPQFEPSQLYQAAQNVAQVPQKINEAIQPMSPQRQELGQGINQAGLELANRGIGTRLGNDPQGWLGAGELAAGDLPAAGREASSTIERANLTPRIDTGISELLRGDVQGAKANFSDTLSRAKARIERMPEEIKQAVVPQVQAGDGENQEPRESLGQNLRGAAQSVGQWVGAKAGEGVDALKEKASNIFEKSPLMGMFQGQKQVGDAKGSTLFEGGGTKSNAPASDSFFKYGGADQYSQYLIDNAEQAKGGALDTSLFKSDFFQDPNNIANVFGETSQGGKATGLYKDYLGSQIKPGFNDPYRTEQRQEGDTLYEYKIPIQEYWQNKYYGDLLKDTPDVLKSGFGYDQFQSPSVSKNVSEYKGDVPVKDSRSPIFKSGLVDLFSRTATQPGQLARSIFKSPASVFQPSQQSRSFEIPEASRSLFQMPTAQSLQIPQTSRKAISSSKPSLSDYLSRGKTAAQYYAETGQQSVADSFGGASKAASAQSAIQRATPFVGMNTSQISDQILTNAYKAGVKPKGVTSGPYQNMSPANANMTSMYTGQPAYQPYVAPAVKDNWLKRLFKK